MLDLTAILSRYLFNLPQSHFLRSLDTLYIWPFLISPLKEIAKLKRGRRLLDRMRLQQQSAKGIRFPCILPRIKYIVHNSL